MGQLTQDNRLISITSPLGKDKLLLTSFQGVEYISDLFEYQVEVLSDDLAIKPAALIGKTVTVHINNDQKRTFNGYVSRFSFGEIKADNLRQYRLTVVPWLWFLTKTNDHRIFQNRTPQDIIKTIFSDLGFNDFEFKSAAGSVREYCLQYNESDFNFVSRLMEEEGWAYFFKQDNDSHKLVVVDKNTGFEKCAEEKVSYSKGNQPGTQITQWDHLYEFRKGNWTLNDYDFKKPATDLLTTKKTAVDLPNIANYEHYEYTGGYINKADGDQYVGYRMEAEEVPYNTVAAVSDCSSFKAGGKFQLEKHDTRGEQAGYLITSINHKAFDSSYFSGSEGQSEYGNSFICIPDNVAFRPQQSHIKPRMPGPQSAIVTGPSGEEIYIDEYGRIKVQFMWDREGKKDENSTCFIRVVQPWAGNNWGTVFTPRIGMEVIVDFLDGNPDRPIITGSVYNQNNMPPFDAKTQSGIKTHSSKGGTASNYNELRFEDKKDAEQIYIHAEKDMDTMVEHDETLTVDNDRTKTIKHDEKSSIGNDRSKSVGNNQSEAIGKDKKISVGENHSETIGKNKTLEVAADHSESIGKNMSIDIGENLAESVGKNYSSDIGKKLIFTAGDEITLKTGSSSIVMKKNGDITIKGKNITIQGYGKIDVKASGNLTLKGSKVSTN